MSALALKIKKKKKCSACCLTITSRAYTSKVTPSKSNKQYFVKRLINKAEEMDLNHIYLLADIASSEKP